MNSLLSLQRFVWYSVRCQEINQRYKAPVALLISLLNVVDQLIGPWGILLTFLDE